MSQQPPPHGPWADRGQPNSGGYPNSSRYPGNVGPGAGGQQQPGYGRQPVPGAQPGGYGPVQPVYGPTHGGAPAGPQPASAAGPYGAPAWPPSRPTAAPTPAPTRGYPVPTQAVPAWQPGPSGPFYSGAYQQGGYPGGPGGAGPTGPQKKSRTALWATLAVVLLAAATTGIIWATQSGGDNNNARTSSSEPVTATGGIREYPSLEVTVDPAQQKQADAAKPQAQKWVQAVNAEDFEGAAKYQCERDQRSNLRSQLRGIEPGSFKVHSIGVSKGKIKLLLAFRVDKAEVTKALSMIEESGDWKVCLALG